MRKMDYLLSVMVLLMGGAISQAVDGTGTANRVPKFQDFDTLQDSAIYEVGGDVGIGITPSSKLTVSGDIRIPWGNGNKIDFYNSEAFKMGMDFNGSSRLMTIYNNSSDAGGHIALMPNIGNVGIGTTTPRAKLDLASQNVGQVLLLGEAANSNVRTGFGLDSSTASMRLFIPEYTGQFFAFGTVSISDGATWSEKMRITHDGNVGIGSTDPDTWLDGNKGLVVYNASGKRSILSLVGESGDNENEILGRILFSNPDTSNTLKRMAMIDGVRGANDNSAHLDFSTTNSGSISQRMRICSDGSVGIGTTEPSAGHKLTVQGNILVRNASGTPVAEMGEGLDVAEGFDVSQNEAVDPGTVLIIDPECPGKLAISNQAYDSKVAGIVAGANNLGSGVRLGVGQFDCDVALAGRVYCNVESLDHAIETGDQLTTSDIPGYAKKADDFVAARGAILGKAMQSLEKGQKGQILVLVTLQ